MEKSNWVRLASYALPYAAEILRGALEANGIAAKVFNSHSTSIMPHLSQAIPADVMVQEKDFAEAQKLLQDFETNQLPEEEE